jgi:hypothetical protein
MREFHAGFEKALLAINFGSLPQGDRIDYLLFRNHLARERDRLAACEKRQCDLRPLVTFERIIETLEKSRRQQESLDAEKVAGQLTRLVRELQEAKKATPIPPWSPALRARAGGRIDLLRSVLKNWVAFYSGYDPAFAWWCEKPYLSADGELEAYAVSLRGPPAPMKTGPDAPPGIDPIGREALLRELAYEMIPYSPEDLIAIAERELAWCESRRKEATRDLGAGEDWVKALEKVKTAYAPPGKQPDLIRDLAREAIRFADAQDLVTVPDLCREIWRMEMTPPEKQKTLPYFTGGEVIHIPYPTLEMTHDEKEMCMRGNNIAFSRAAVPHEIIPGHHLQLFIAERHRSYRKLFRTPFLVEGWGLYCELLMWDRGFARSAEDRLGMLFWRSHRAARVIVTLKFHLGQMSSAEGVTFLVERVGHESRSAGAEVRRYFAGDYPPLYQCAYLVGALQIRALYEELVGSGMMNARTFHDALLRENAIPVEMIRASLKEEKLSWDFTPRWRFAE